MTLDLYKPKSQQQVQQQQLLAQKLGLDLAHLQQFTLNPNAFKQKFAKQFNPETNTFNIEGVTPGGLIGAPQGPNGSVLAAGSTPTNPLDLGGVKSSAVQPGSVTFLPPYMQPGAAAPEANPTAPAAAPQIDSLLNPAAVGTPQKMNRPNAGMIGVPYYLRGGSKRKTQGNSMISYG